VLVEFFKLITEESGKKFGENPS